MLPTPFGDLQQAVPTVAVQVPPVQVLHVQALEEALVLDPLLEEVIPNRSFVPSARAVVLLLPWV